MSEPYVQKLEEIAQSEPVTMPKQPRMTNAQMDFLRNLRKHPNSLPLLAWPRATTLRKWMRRPRFRAAIRSLEGAFEVEARLLMAGAAAQAAMQLQATLTGGRIETSGEGISPMELQHYRGPIKQCLQVLWMEMVRRQHSRPGAIEQEILRRMGERSPATDDAAADAVANPNDIL
jgi:hypothetical protein